MNNKNKLLFLALFWLGNIFPTEALSQQATPVTIYKVPEIKICTNLEGVGSTEAFESSVITANVTEKVVEINFEDGQYVNKGAILVVLDKSEEEAELESFQAILLERKTNYERGKELVASKTISESDLLTREAALKQVEANIDQTKVKIQDRIIRAPFSGRVGIRQVSQGALVRPGDVITTIYDNSKLRINFEIPSRFLPEVKVGLPIYGKIDAYPDKIFQGEIAAVNPAVDPVTRTIQVRGIIPNDEDLLKPGFFVELDITTKSHQGIIIPEESVSRLGNDAFVYKLSKKEEQLIATRTQVQLSVAQSGYVEVLEGLKAGDEIVLRGILGTSDELNARKSDIEIGTPSDIQNLGCKGV